MQERVADLVPGGVVDALEVVEVEEQGRHLLPAAREGVLQPIPEQDAVGEAGQRVVEGAPLELGLERLALVQRVAQVAHDPAETRDDEQEQQHRSTGHDHDVDRSAGEHLDDEHRRTP